MDTLIITKNDKLKLDYSWNEFPVHFGVLDVFHVYAFSSIVIG